MSHTLHRIVSRSTRHEWRERYIPSLVNPPYSSSSRSAVVVFSSGRG